MWVLLSLSFFICGLKICNHCERITKFKVSQTWFEIPVDLFHIYRTTLILKFAYKLCKQSQKSWIIDTCNVYCSITNYSKLSSLMFLFYSRFSASGIWERFSGIMNHCAISLNLNHVWSTWPNVNGRPCTWNMASLRYFRADWSLGAHLAWNFHSMAGLE